PPPAPHDDPDVRAEAAAALAELPAGPGAVVTGAEPAAGPDGTDLAVTLFITPAGPAPADQADLQADLQQAVQRAAEAIAARLASRFRRGIQFSAVLAPATPAAPAPSRAHG
ncbi:MAG TPA: hypothetical protein VN847_21655, partial [Streptosporangiaceae bacterium]|nr:hypothetical protein [Streptosporangiaceae bacterium]